jgi:hypothetical protein
LKSKPRIIWIQMKGLKSNIFEFNSRLSKRDLNLFKDPEIGQGRF